MRVRMILSLLGTSLLIFASCLTAKASGAQQPIILWPNGAPGAMGHEPTDIPTLTPYLPAPEKATGAAIIICPGGGYEHLSEREGRPVAEWLNSVGVTAFVLKYRIGPRYHHPAPLLDAARSLRLVRTRAKEWGLDPARIGILGFSAGGHLASTLGTHFDAGKMESSDPIERVSSRPDVMILIYPVITMREKTHAGSKKNLLGENPSPDAVALLSNDEQVTKETPPSFLVHTFTDTTVPLENSCFSLRRSAAQASPLNFTSTNAGGTASRSEIMTPRSLPGRRAVQTGCVCAGSFVDEEKRHIA